MSVCTRGPVCVCVSALREFMCLVCVLAAGVVVLSDFEVNGRCC